MRHVLSSAGKEAARFLSMAAEVSLLRSLIGTLLPRRRKIDKLIADLYSHPRSFGVQDESAQAANEAFTII